MHKEVSLVVDLGRSCRRQTVPACMEVESSGVDHFDQLPDSLLLLIFNKLADIKALGRCCAVSKRFHDFAPLVDNVVVKVDCVISGEDGSIHGKGRGLLSHFMRFVVGSIVKPLQALQHLLAPKKAIVAEVSHHSPVEVLKNFKEIRNLRIELPGGELGVDEGVLLKWRAEFGSSLESCVILGAASTAQVAKDGKVEKLEGLVAQDRGEDVLLGGDEVGDVAGVQQDDSGSIPESFYTDGELKLRVVWTISSLIAASARHYLLQQIIAEHPTLEKLVLTDADGQGMLCMDHKQLHEFRDKPLAPSASANRTQVPALNMKLWYAPRLELPGGTRLNGATLVAIRPSETQVKREERLTGDYLKIQEPGRRDADGCASSYSSGAFEEPVATAFEEPFNTAASILVKRRTYLLEMNSF